MKLKIALLYCLSLPLLSSLHAQPNPAASAAPRNEWMETHQGYVDRARQGDVDVVFLGDSITNAWRSAGKEFWAERFAPLKAVNFGIGGDRTENVLWRIQNGELDGIKPRAVVLMIGTNNLKQAHTPEQIAEGVGAIVTEIRARQPQAKILLFGVFPRDAEPTAERRAKITQINGIIAKLDDGGKTVRYLDIGAQLLEPDGRISPEMMPDYLHPAKPGYKIWADALQEPLAEILK
jgi:lysophospholipase L1-like esterase